MKKRSLLSSIILLMMFTSIFASRPTYRLVLKHASSGKTAQFNLLGGRSIQSKADFIRQQFPNIEERRIRDVFGHDELSLWGALISRGNTRYYDMVLDIPETLIPGGVPSGRRNQLIYVQAGHTSRIHGTDHLTPRWLRAGLFRTNEQREIKKVTTPSQINAPDIAAGDPGVLVITRPPSFGTIPRKRSNSTTTF